MTPKRISLSSNLCLLLLVLCSTLNSFAADFTQTVSREGGQIGLTQTPAGQTWDPTPVTIYDEFFGVSAPTGTLRDVYVTGVLKINDRLRKVYTDNWKLEITYEIKLYNAANTLVQTLTGETLTITYFKKNAYDDYAQKIYRSGNDYHKAVVSVTQIKLSLLDDAGAVLSSSTPTSLGPLYDDVSMEWQCTSIRSLELRDDAIPAVNHVSGTNINPGPVCTTNAADNLIRLAWTYQYGAESYDVEWLFLDIPPTSVTAQGVTLPSVSQSFEFDWRNATRVNVTDTRYDIPLLYPTGVIVYRVRPVGVDLTNDFARKEGTWSREPGGYMDNLANIGNNDRFVYCGLETEQNWTSTLSFAEEGKRKGIVSFVDGAGHTRQTITTLSTDQNTVVLEPSLDHMGRPAVQYLPVPVRGEHFNYFPAFNGGFDANVYDTDAGYPTNTPVNGIDPLANSAVDDFYSTANPFVNLTGITTPTPYDEYLANLTAYLPEARSYPFTQTRFMNDGSGRPHSSSGVGGTHMLGGGHDMRYYYGTPTQVEIDRLFGSEAGFRDYYKKNLTVDPNGQISAAYLDGYGRTVATALVGTGTQDLLSPIFTAPLSFTEDMLSDNHEVDLVKTSQRNITVGIEAQYDFSYSVTPADYQNLCLGNFECRLEFLVSVTDQEGVEQLNPPPGWKNVSETTFPYDVSVVLTPGTYTVTKLLRIVPGEYPDLEQQANNAIGTDWHTQNSCFTPPFAISCPDCSTQCVNAYKYEYTFQGNPYWIYRNLVDSGPDYTTISTLANLTDANGDPLFTFINFNDSLITAAEAAIAACQDLCGNTPEANTGTECEMKRILLLRDLLPDGQYFENRPKDPDISGVANAFYTTGSENHPDNRNAWMEAYASDLRDDFGALLNPPMPSPTWEDIRANWGSIDQNDPGFQTLKNELFTRHPEYCAWKAFCGNMETPCLCEASGNTSYYETPRNYADVMQNTQLDASAAEARLFAPTGILPTITGYSGSFPVTDYLPSGGIVEELCMDDPLLYCNPELRSQIHSRLVNHMPLTVHGNPLNLSVWYLVDNPENLHLHDLSLGSHPDYPDAFVAYMQVLHGSPSNPGGGLLAPWNTAPQPNQITRWQFFRSVYEYHRMQLIYTQAVNDITACIDCPNPATVHPLCTDMSGGCTAPVACTELPFLSAWDSDDDGTLDMGTGNNGFGFAGMEVRYPYIGLLASPPTAQDLAATYCETNCSALAAQWISQLQSGIRACTTPDAGIDPAEPPFTLPEAQKQVLRNYFVNICMHACEDQNNTGNYTHDYTEFTGMTAGDWSGTPYAMGAYYPQGSTNVVNNINDAVKLYMDHYGDAWGCPVLINPMPVNGQPAPDLNAFNCSCSRLADFISENNGLVVPTFSLVNPLKWEVYDSNPATVLDFAEIQAALGESGLLSPTELAQMQGLSDTEFRNLLLHWLSACNGNASAQIPPLSLNGETISFPVFLACDSDSVSFPDPLDCNTLQQEEQETVNATAFSDFMTEQMTTFLVEYPRHCLDNAVETFTMTYQIQEYHYTLYYYDQAGNLIKTVPPAGVSTIDNQAALTAIHTFRKAHHHEPDYAQQAGFVWPAHSKITNYVYNGQNQVTRQSTPDGGTTLFFYDALGRLVLSQNARQEQDHVHSYTLFDAISRVTEVGEMPLLPSFSSNRVETQRFVEGLIDASGYSPFITEVEANKTSKTQITRTFYDRSYFPDWNMASSILNQQNLRNRVAGTAYYAVYPALGWGYYDNATHYSYDVHGNVNRLLQDIPFLQAAERRFLYTDYVYDLVSGNVNEVHYMKGFAEQFSHYYRYDADNRLTLARTSKNGGIIKELEAKYFYYPTGALARTELGRAQVQGMDHAYSIQGWLKAVNGDDINTRVDIGKDARYDTYNLHALFGMDAAGFTLGYFNDDYSPLGNIVSFEAGLSAADDMAVAMHPNTGALPTWGLYNGNIAKMVTAQLNQAQQPMEILGRSFMYDQLNRLMRASAFTRANATDHQSVPSVTDWNGVTQDSRWNTHYTYDADGNLQSLFRDGDNGAMDQLYYTYEAGNNRLNTVEDYVPAGNYPDDLDDQAPGNYQYDEIGNLVSDVTGEIADIRWTVYGKVKSVQRTTGSSKQGLWMGYSPGGQRIVKLSDTWNPEAPGKNATASVYALDAQGNIMAIYEYKKLDDGSRALFCAEQMIYGSKRLGTLHRDQKLCSPCTLPFTALENSRYESVDPQDPPETTLVTLDALQTAVLGTREYEFTNHLGNVLATVADRKTHLSADVLGSGASALVFQYRPEVITSGEYYPFGSPLPGRNPAQACSTVTSQQTLYAVNEDFTNRVTGDIVAPDWAVSAAPTTRDVVTDGGINKALRMVTATRYAGFARYFTTIPGTAYTAKVKLRNTQGLNVSIRRREVGNPANYQQVTGQTKSAGATYTELSFTFTAQSGWEYYLHVENQATTGISNTFYADDIQIYYTADVTTTLCDPVDGYRFGFNGQEKENDLHGEGLVYSFEYRVHDARLGRFLSVDPLEGDYPWQNAYCFAANSPIILIDFLGAGPGDPPATHTTSEGETLWGEAKKYFQKNKESIRGNWDDYWKSVQEWNKGGNYGEIGGTMFLSEPSSATYHASRNPVSFDLPFPQANLSVHTKEPQSAISKWSTSNNFLASFTYNTANEAYITIQIFDFDLFANPYHINPLTGRQAFTNLNGTPNYNPINDAAGFSLNFLPISPIKFFKNFKYAKGAFHISKFNAVTWQQTIKQTLPILKSLPTRQRWQILRFTNNRVIPFINNNISSGKIFFNPVKKTLKEEDKGID